MERRHFIKALAAAGIASYVGEGWPGTARAEAPTDRPLFLTATCPGGWDVSIFCDPKIGVDFPLNAFSEKDLRAFGPFTLGPGSLAAVQFFERYHKQILLINGVYAETIDHGVGRRLVASGGSDGGFPSFDALAAASLGPALGLSYVTGGGYDETANEIAKTLVAPSLIAAMQSTASSGSIYTAADSNAIATAIAERLKRLRERPSLAIREKKLEQLAQSRMGWEAFPAVLKTVADIKAKVPYVQGVTGDPKAVRTDANRIFLSVQMALAGYVNNATVSASLAFGNCDQHTNFGQHHLELDGFFIGMDYLWRVAAYLGIADRITLNMGSDFARTPENISTAADPGKGHWANTTSIILMGAHVPGGKLIGQTTRDKSFKAMPLNFGTLKPAASGSPLLRAHIHDELRRVAGFQNHPLAKKYPLTLPGGSVRILT